MALSTNRELDHYVDQELRSLPVAAAQHIYKGGLVGITTTGFARPLAAGDAFGGIAYEEQDNTGGANGALSVRLYTLGDFGHALTGAASADIGRPVFASADDTLTFTAPGNAYVGIVRDMPVSNQVLLRIDTDRGRIKTVSHAVENLTAGQDVAPRAVHAFDTEGWIVSSRLVNQSTVAAGIDNANTCVVTVASGVGTVATTTFDATTVFPSPNQSKDLGSISNGHVTTGTVLTLAVTNGTNANPGSFVIEVDYI